MKSSIFVTNKPMFVSSNHHLKNIKKKYDIKKAGFSGTLDPFAKGSLIIATGSYTKLFPYIKKTPKIYQATLWLGLKSLSLDIENIISIKETPKQNPTYLKSILKSLIGEITYKPPVYSAKKVNGKELYKYARENKKVNIKEVIMQVYDMELLCYHHPFLSFKISLSEGGYVRSIGEIIGKRLNVDCALSYLVRLKEGDFIYQNEKPLNIFNHINIKENIYFGESQDIAYGKPINIKNLMIKENGEYILKMDKFLSIIQINNKIVKYKLNAIII